MNVIGRILVLQVYKVEYMHSVFTNWNRTTASYNDD